jgi:hypothetical protein
MPKNITDDLSGRDRALARLWELADLSPETTRGSIAGQIKAMAMIVAIEGLIPDRRHSQTRNQPAPSPAKPPIYDAEWPRKQKEREAESEEPQDIVVAKAAAPDPEPAPQPATGTIFGATDPRAPLWMRMKKRRRP